MLRDSFIEWNFALLTNSFILHNPSVAQSNLDNQKAELHDIVQALYVWIGFPEGCQAEVVLGSE